MLEQDRRSQNASIFSVWETDKNYRRVLLVVVFREKQQIQFWALVGYKICRSSLGGNLEKESRWEVRRAMH